MDLDQHTKLPTNGALETLMCAAKLGLRLSREGASLVYRSEQRIVSCWVSSKFEDNRDELAAFVPNLGQSNDCIVPIRPVANPRVNLVCVHTANGNTFDYHHVAQSMPDMCSVYGCDALEGLFARQPDVSLQSMTNHYVAVLRQSQLTQMPLALYGGSTGGRIVLEMARQMAVAGSPPELIVLGDTRDPVSSSVHAHYRIERLKWNAFIEALFPTEMWDVCPPDHAFWKLQERERLRYLRDRLAPLQYHGRVLAAIDPQLIEDYFLSFGRYFNCYSEYVPRPYFGKALFLKASKAPQDATSTMISMLKGDTRVQTIDGLHESFYWPPVASAVANAISEAIMDSLNS